MEKKNKIIPKLCFPGFEEESWVSARLGEIMSFKVTYSFTRDDLNYEKGTIKSIHYGDIHKKFQILFDITKENIPYINEKVNTDKIKEENFCREGDVILADASEDLNDVGKSIELVELNNEKVVSGLHTILARPKEGLFPKGFLGYLFKSDSVRKGIQKEAQGTKVFSISATRLQNLIIHYPLSIINSQKIADCLSSLDDLITAERQKLELLKDHKKGLLQNLFPHRLDYDLSDLNEEQDSKNQKNQKNQSTDNIPRLRFPEFQNSGAWKPRKLNEFIKERNEIADNRLPLFSLTIEDGITQKSERYERSFLVKNEENAYKVVHHGDFALNPMNLRFGAIARYSGLTKVAVSKYYNIFFCDDSVDSVFCFVLFKSPKMLSVYDDISTGTLIEKRRVHFSNFINLEILLPSKPEQQKIADCLSSLDDLITAQTKKIELLELHKKGLLQGLFPELITN